MNKVTIKDHIWSDFISDDVDGKLLDGSYYVEDSLAQDELSVDTLKFRVRYPLEGDADTSPLSWPYGTPCMYYQDNNLFGKFYLVEITRVARYEYEFDFQSAIGLLKDSTHYGGYYHNKPASQIIGEIINGKIPYTCHAVFDKINLYGWLPIDTARNNLQQLLFATGGIIKKNSSGDCYITTLNVNTPIQIADNRVMESGSITYNSDCNVVAVTEHGFYVNDDTEVEEIFKGELAGQSFITPLGNAVTNAAIVKWDGPYHSLELENCTLINNECNCNYAIVTSSPNAVVRGKPYKHTQAIVYKNKSTSGEDKVATVEKATLVSLSNSASTAERVMAYYGNANTLDTSFVLNGEKSTDMIEITDPFGDRQVGFIKSIDGNFGNHVNRGDTEVVLNYVPPTVVGSRVLKSIKVTTPPQTSYATGDYFNPEGMVVTAYYDDDSTNIINNYLYSPKEALKATDTKITITYTEVGVTCVTTLPIDVTTVLRRIAVTSPPNTTDYEVGETFDKTGMVVTAYYSDGSYKAVTDYTFTPTRALTKADTEVLITYVEDSVHATTYQDISVGDERVLESISITKAPSKTVYKVGEYFNTTGMIVTATFTDGTKKAVRGYTYAPATAFTASDTKVTVSYTKSGVTCQAYQDVTVIYLTSIAITNPPTYTAYYEDNNFNKFGMEVTAYYSNNSSRVLLDAEYTVTPTVLKCGDTEVTISYTEANITKTATQEITVTYYPYDFTQSKVLAESGTYSLSDLGATHRNLRIVVIGGGTGGQGGTNGSAGGNSNATSISSGGSGNYYSNGGAGGSGGTGGAAGASGKVYSYDIVLDSNSSTLQVTVGAGGAGGSNGATGSAGGNTTVKVDGITVDSNSGSNSDTGYTDTFTTKTFAGAGSKGYDGAAGGQGGAINPDTGTNGGDVLTYTGGTYTKNTTVTDSGSANKYVQTWSNTGNFKNQTSSKDWGNGAYRSVWRGKAIAQNSDGTVYCNGQYSAKYPIGWNGSSYTTGITYNINPYNNKPAESVTKLVANYLTYEECAQDSSKSSGYAYNTGSQGYNVQYTSTNHSISYGKGYSANGGGGAAYGTSATSSTGANAASPAVAPNYGYGGNGGHGGGGGGGAGGTGCEINTILNQGNSVVKKSLYQAGQSGSSGGSGSAGAKGGDGCVIVYFS